MSELKIAVFDTETTGLPLPSPAKLEKQPYIIELYACVIDQDFNMLREFDSLFSIGFSLPEIIPKITGIYDKDLIGQPTFGSKVAELAKFFTGVDAVVAHNYKFDQTMLANELLRCNRLIQFPWPRHNICTVEKSISIRGHRLKLSQLHEIVTGKPFNDAHRAKNDVMALVRCFHGLVERKLISLDDLEK